jgi:hypothetical protein
MTVRVKIAGQVNMKLKAIGDDPLPKKNILTD